MAGTPRRDLAHGWQRDREAKTASVAGRRQDSPPEGRRGSVPD